MPRQHIRDTTKQAVWEHRVVTIQHQLKSEREAFTPLRLLHGRKSLVNKCTKFQQDFAKAAQPIELGFTAILIATILLTYHLDDRPERFH